MNITELTPPVEREFSLELNENELKLLAICIGDISGADLRLRMSEYNKSEVGIAVFDETFTDNLYFTILKHIKL